TSTSSAGRARCLATDSHIASASALPVSPVAALALPLLQITAQACPPVAARCACEAATGAAVSALDVNTAAVATGSPSAVATRARSGSPESLSPQVPPAATNPAAAVTLTASSP